MLAGILHCWHDCLVRIRRRSRSGIDLGRAKLDRHVKASLRQRDFRGANRGNVRLALAQIALNLFFQKLLLDQRGDNDGLAARLRSGNSLAGLA